MTTKEKLINMLINMGMFPKQAEEVFSLAKYPVMLGGHEIGYENITWDRDSNEYPEVMYNIWMLEIKKVAILYIEEYCPQAWFKAMFN